MGPEGRMGGIKRHAMGSASDGDGPARLGEIAEAGLDIFCWCNRCTHNAVIPAAGLLARLGPAMPVPEIGTRLRCSGCGAKDVATRPAWPGLGPVARHS